MALTKKGTASNDYLLGDNENNLLIGLGGNDTLNGAAGADTALYSGSLAEYRFSNVGGQLVIQDLVAGNGQEGKDTLISIEKLQ